MGEDITVRQALRMISEVTVPFAKQRTAHTGSHYVWRSNQWPGVQPSYGPFKNLYIFDRIGGYPTGWKFWEETGCR